MGGDSSESVEFDARLTADLKQRVATLMSENPTMSATDAMREAQAALLAQAEAELFHKISDFETRNNPFRPPATGCPVNDLPPELLAHIFMLGCEMDEEGNVDYEDDEDSDLEEEEWETDDEEGEADEEIVEEDNDVRMGSPDKRKVPRRSVGDVAPPETDEEDSDDEGDLDDEDEEEEPFLPFQSMYSGHTHFSHTHFNFFFKFSSGVTRMPTLAGGRAWVAHTLDNNTLCRAPQR